MKADSNALCDLFQTIRLKILWVVIIMGETDSTTGQHEVKVYWTRWYILVVFGLNVILQSIAMLVYMAVPSTIQEDVYPEAHISDGDLNLILSIGSLSFLVFVVFMFVVDGLTTSLRTLTLVSAITLSIHCVLRLFPHWIPSLKKDAFAFMMITQLLNQIGCAFSYSLPTRVSATWFPPNERGVITGVASQVSGIGCAFSFLVVPLITDTSTGFVAMLYILLVLQVLVTILIIVYFPAAPPTPPSYSEMVKDESHENKAQGEPVLSDAFVQASESRIKWVTRTPPVLRPLMEAWLILLNPQFLLILWMAALHTGALQGWAANLPTMLGDIGMSETAAGVVTFFHLTASIIGCIVLSFFMQRWLGRTVWRLFLVYFIINTAFLLLLLFFMPFGGRDENQPIIHARGACSAIVIMTGIAAGGPIPLFFECGAEMTYPAPDAITGGLVTAATALGYFLVPFIFSFVGSGWMQLVAVIAEALIIPFSLLVRVDLNRQDVEVSKGQSEAGSSNSSIESSSSEEMKEQKDTNAEEEPQQEQQQEAEPANEEETQQEETSAEENGDQM